MKLIFSPDGWEDYLFWQGHEAAVLAHVNELIKNTLRTPFTGIGKPEPFKARFKGFWSRRITGEHRLVYRVSGTGEAQAIEIAACRFQYE